MKFAKLSLAVVALAGITSSAMAMDLSSVTVKPYAKAKLYYEATDRKGADLFSQGKFNTPTQGAASGQALLTAGVTGKFDSCWGYGFEYNVADTLGLENNLVSGVRMGADENGNPLQTQDWASQAYITYSPCDTILSNTTFKIGRQFLDTPLAFTEKWNLAPNSFDAIVALNQDIKNVTLVGAYVGRGNGAKIAVSNGDRFSQYGLNDIAATPGVEKARGAYAVGALTKFIDGLPINLWYYNVVGTADAVWADAAYTYKFADDMAFNLGAQYGSIMPKGVLDGIDDTAGFGVKIGTKIGMFDVMAAYSSMDDDGVVALANTATLNMSNGAGTTGGKKTKLYTAGIYTDGTGVAIPGSDAYKVKASANVAGIGKFIAQYVVCENDNNKAMQNVSELDIIYATKLAGINTKLIYMSRSIDEGKNPAGGWLEDDTQHVRVILSKSF